MSNIHDIGILGKEKLLKYFVRSNSTVGWEELSIETDLDQYPLNSALSNLFRDQTIHKDNFGNYQIVDEEIRQEWEIHLGIATPKEAKNNISTRTKTVNDTSASSHRATNQPRKLAYYVEDN